MVRHEHIEKKGADPPATLPAVTPIPCRECSTLAMILLDNIPLCRSCIIKATADREPRWIERHSRPLSIIGPVRAKDPSRDGKNGTNHQKSAV